MGDVNLEIKLGNLDERVIKIEESGGGSGGDGYITSVSNDFNVINKKLSLSNDVITKLSNIDNKIDKPSSATDGQVLTYNGTSNEWEAQDSKGGSITEPTELEKGIIGGDEWVSGGSYTIDKSVVIDENKLYLLVGDGGSTTKPSTDATHSIWEETSISELNSKLNSSLGDISGFTGGIYNSLGAYIQYCVDNNYLPNLNNTALVPKLTDNTNVIYSDNNTKYKPYMAFDLTNTGTKKYNSGYTTDCTSKYIGYNFNRQVIVKKFSLGGSNNNNTQDCNFDLEGSNNGTNWTKIASITAKKNTAQNFSINNETSYSQIRLRCTSTKGTYTDGNNSLISIMGLQFYGKIVS